MLIAILGDYQDSPCEPEALCTHQGCCACRVLSRPDWRHFLCATREPQGGLADPVLGFTGPSRKVTLPSMGKPGGISIRMDALNGHSDQRHDARGSLSRVIWPTTFPCI